MRLSPGLQLLATESFRNLPVRLASSLCTCVLRENFQLDNVRFDPVLSSEASAQLRWMWGAECQHSATLNTATPVSLSEPAQKYSSLSVSILSLLLRLGQYFVSEAWPGAGCNCPCACSHVTSHEARVARI